jgi:hypothetical protein
MKSRFIKSLLACLILLTLSTACACDEADLATPPPESADLTGIISDPEGDVDFGFIDIISVEMTIEGEEVAARLQLLELPETLIFNQAPGDYLEYNWVIYFDIDGDPSTGSPSDCGAEYALGISHWVFGAPDEDSILGACQKDLWKNEGTSMTRQGEAIVETDYATNTLTIRGTIPGLNMNSRWFAMTYYWDPVSERPWQDRYPDIGFVTLTE